MRRTQYIVNAVVFLLVCSGIYGSFYSIVLIWNKDGVEDVGQGFQTRTVYTADEIVQVVLITREDRLAGAITLINSIVSNTKQPVHFSIITDNNTVEHAWEWIEQSQLSSISYEIKGLTISWLMKFANISKDEAKPLPYARILLDKIFPNLKTRIIFLDDDIVVQGDVNDLFRSSIKSGHVGAFSSDCDELSVKYKYPGSQYGNLIYVHKSPLLPLQLNSSACTFSLGVSLIDVQQWQEQNISQKALHWIQVNKKIKLYKAEDSLSALLIALHKKFTHLDSSWHVRNLGLRMTSPYDQSTLNKAKLLHWNGPHKPWTEDVANSELWDLYFVPDPTRKFSHPRLKSI